MTYKRIKNKGKSHIKYGRKLIWNEMYLKL